jgi:hypothetical protein
MGNLEEKNLRFFPIARRYHEGVPVNDRKLRIITDHPDRSIFRDTLPPSHNSLFDIVGDSSTGESTTGVSYCEKVFLDRVDPQRTSRSLPETPGF